MHSSVAATPCTFQVTSTARTPVYLYGCSCAWLHGLPLFLFSCSCLSSAYPTSSNLTFLFCFCLLLTCCLCNTNEQEEAERDGLEKQEMQLGREKSKLSTELMALQAKKNDATDPTEELERALEVATEVKPPTISITRQKRRGRCALLVLVVACPSP